MCQEGSECDEINECEYTGLPELWNIWYTWGFEKRGLPDAKNYVSKIYKVVIQAVHLSAGWRKSVRGTCVALPASHKLGYLNGRQMSQNGAQRYSYS